jgi:TatD DNase family protein
MQFIDSHAHINAEQFKNHWQETITSAHQVGVTSIINNASNLHDSRWGIEQAEQSTSLYTTVGIHPEWFLESDEPVTDADFTTLRQLAIDSPKVVAIGEIGLDYTLDQDKATKRKQFDLIEPQIQLAIDLNLPITLHVRDLPGHTDCFTDMIAILQNFQHSTSEFRPPTSSAAPRLTGVFHCWVGTPAQAEQALNLGFYLSFSGILTYKSAGHILDVAAQAPEHRILIETDAPYLTPEPARSQKKPALNEPQYVIMTAEKLAVLRNVSLEHVAQMTTQNTRQLFSL